MDTQRTCIEAVQAVKHVVAHVRDDQWNMSLPADFPMTDRTSTMRLRDVINRVAYDMAWVPDMLSGKTMEEVGNEKFRGNVLGDDPKTAFAAIAEAALTAIHELDALDRTVRCSYAEYPAHSYFNDIASYYGMSAYDIAGVIGIDPTLSPDLVEGLWEQILPVAEEWRAMGILAPKIDVPDDADLHTRLLGLIGRQP